MQKQLEQYFGKMLEDRFVFIEYKNGMVGVEVSPYTIMVDN